MNERRKSDQEVGSRLAVIESTMGHMSETVERLDKRLFGEEGKGNGEIGSLKGDVGSLKIWRWMITGALGLLAFIIPIAVYAMIKWG